MSMYDAPTPTQPPGFMAMLGDTIGLPGLIASGRLIGSKIPGLLARYGASAGGSLAGGPLTAGLTAAQVMAPQPVNAGEIPMYVQDASGKWVPNPANPIVRAHATQAAINPQSAPPPAAPQAQASPMQTAMAPPQQAAVPMPTPRPAMPPPAPMPSPLNLAPPAPGQTAPPPNLYNGPGSQNFGMSSLQSPSGGIPNGANITSALQALRGGQIGSMFAPQSQQLQQSNPAGNILPFIKNLFSGSSGSAGPASSDPTQGGSLY